MADAPAGYDPVDLEHLLAVQAVDTEIDRLLHQRSHLPERAAIEAVTGEAGAVRTRLAEATQTRNALADQQTELETEIETMTKRIAQLDGRLYGSSPLSPKDAQAMTEEVAHLRERRSAFEDRELEIMEALEPAQAALNSVNGEAKLMSAELSQLQAVLGEGEARIDGELHDRRAARADAAELVPGPLLEEYDKLRQQLGGTAVARLEGTSCGGCHLSMAGGELDAIRKAPAGELVYCEECGRILVR